MAGFSELKCEPCNFKNVTKSASTWCTDCQEGYCDDCCTSHKAQKMSRNHNLISMEYYETTKQFNINLECPTHSKLLGFYCPTHDSIVCVACVQSKHVSCEDLRPLDEAAKGAKTSTALTDLEQTIDGLLKNIEKGVQHLQQNKTNLEEQGNVTKKSIAAKRAEINKHFDLLEEKLLKKLKSKSDKAMNEISFMTINLETQHKRISDLKDTAKNMMGISSNLQVFVGIRSIQNTVVNEINGIKLLVNSISQVRIAVQFNPKFDTITEVFNSLGEIQITSNEEIVPYVEQRLIQAQHQRPAEPPVHKLDNLQLKLRTNIKMDGTNSCVTSCLILLNKCVMIMSNKKSSLTILKEDGSHDHDIRVPYRPYDVTIIDDQRVAVSYGGYTCITIVDINNQSLKKLSHVCKRGGRGITYNDGKLYAVAPYEGIKVIDLDGKIIKTIRIYNDASTTEKVAIQKDKIYFSVNNGSVYCIDIDGNKIWTCQDDQLLHSPAIAVDNYGITFATVYKNSLLLAISPDGKQQKVILTSSDGLQNPNAVYYDKDSKRLLVCNQENAALYDVTY